MRRRRDALVPTKALTCCRNRVCCCVNPSNAYVPRRRFLCLERSRVIQNQFRIVSTPLWNLFFCCCCCWMAAIQRTELNRLCSQTLHKKFWIKIKPEKIQVKRKSNWQTNTAKKQKTKTNPQEGRQFQEFIMALLAFNWRVFGLAQPVWNELLGELTAPDELRTISLPHWNVSHKHNLWVEKSSRAPIKTNYTKQTRKQVLYPARLSQSCHNQTKDNDDRKEYATITPKKKREREREKKNQHGAKHGKWLREDKWIGSWTFSSFHEGEIEVLNRCKGILDQFKGIAGEY